MKTILKPEFILTFEEVEQYNNLPDNLPDTKLTKKQIDFVNSLYYKYIGKTIDNKDWSLPMYKEELKEKWPSGPRIKQHEAMRIILNNLVDAQSKMELTQDKAVSMFYYALTSRPMYAKLLKNIYSIES